MNEKYLIIKGKVEEVDQLKEYIEDYKQQTRELESISILGEDLYKEYWKMEFKTLKEEYKDIITTEEKLDKVVDMFIGCDIQDDIDDIVNDFYWKTCDMIENNEIEW